MMHKYINTDQAPKAVGPYSQAILASGQQILFISGQIPLDPVTMKVEAQDVRAQTKVVLKNLLAVLNEAGANIRTVTKATVYIKNMDDFATINEEYEKVFSEHKPARACVEVARLPKDVLVEIDAIAVF
jgi:2-iminobutanoate/2-iminopropanoate deaminase